MTSRATRTQELPRKIRVLLLEDRKQDAELLVRELRRAEFDPEWTRVETETAFLAALDDSIPDLILADFNLPQYDGISALMHLQERGLDIPFLLVSGTVGEEVAVNAIKRGADDYLIKDRLARLGSAVSRAIENKQIRDEQKLAEIALRDSEERWRLALEGSGSGVWDWNVQTNKVLFSKRWKELLGHDEDEIGPVLDEWASRIHPGDMTSSMEELKDYIDGKLAKYSSEFRMRCKDGNYKWTKAHGMIVNHDAEGRPLRMIGTLADITERKLAEETIWKQANFDTLTGLPNRRMFHDRLDQEIKRANRLGLQLVLMFLDLDRFKEVNDTLGHGMGDVLLKEAANRLSSCVRSFDTVARLGGDEFTVILGELDDTGSAERVAQDILRRLSDPFQLGAELVYITASIGITIYPVDATRVADLTKNADQAMYAAKSLGRNRYHYFTQSMQEAAQTRMRLANDLRSALAENQFIVYYQPIVDLKTGAIHKAEALLRWQHPVRGLISPDEFIPIAEETGLIVAIGDWVFREAAEHVAKWRDTNHPGFQVSINTSPAQFYKLGENSHVIWADILQKLGLTGNSVVMEITEGLLLDANVFVTDQLLVLRDIGIQVAIDDFGTGYSSLSYLKKFDIDYLKIDQSFISNLSHGSNDMVLCEAIILMAHKLGMQVIAEGVETEHQKQLLTEAGCCFGQGFLFSNPLPADEFKALLQKA